jgi:hypothetical protein
MKRFALVLTVAALAAVSCATPGVTPATTSSSSTTLAGASAREASFDSDFSRTFGVDSSFYPSGAQVVAQGDNAVQPGFCVALAVEGPIEVPGSRVCPPFALVRGVWTFTAPVPLGEGLQYYFPAAVDAASGEIVPNYGSIRVRW